LYFNKKYDKLLSSKRGDVMKTFLLIVSVLLIAIVLLQSNKAEGASQIISGGNADLFGQRKERGLELFISRATFVLGALFFIICLVMNFM
jgi:preprotein translocase subunit SecG